MLDTRLKVIGIDPGSEGGIAYYLDWQEAQCIPMPKTEQDIFENLTLMVGAEQNCLVYIERVSGFIGSNEEGKQRNIASGHTMFTFGQNYGFLRGILCTLRIPVIEAHPKSWQKVAGVSKYPGESKTEHKNRMKGKAQQLFPHANITLHTADAMLIAWYGHISQKRRM